MAEEKIIIKAVLDSKDFERAVDRLSEIAKTPLQNFVDTVSGFNTIADGVKNLTTFASGFSGPMGMVVTVLSLAIPLIVTLTDKLSSIRTEAQLQTEVAHAQYEATKKLADGYRDATEQRKQSTSDATLEAQVTADLAKKVENLAAREHKTAEEKAILKGYVDDLNERVPNLALAYDSVTDSLNLTNDEINTHIERMKDEAVAEAAAAAYGEAALQRLKLKKDETNAQNDLTKAKEKTAIAEAECANAEAGWDFDEKNAALIEARKQEDEYANALKEVKSALSDTESEMKLYSGVIKDSRTNIANAVPDTVDLKNRAKESGIAIPQGIQEGIDAGGEKAKEAAKQLEAMLTFEEAVLNAGESGEGIMGELAAKIKAGESLPVTALNDVENLMKFGMLMEDAKLAGDAIMQDLAASIADGSKSPYDALQEAFAQCEELGIEYGGLIGTDSGGAITEKATTSIEEGTPAVVEAETKKHFALNELGKLFALLDDSQKIRTEKQLSDTEEGTQALIDTNAGVQTDVNTNNEALAGQDESGKVRTAKEISDTLLGQGDVVGAVKTLVDAANTEAEAAAKETTAGEDIADTIISGAEGERGNVSDVIKSVTLDAATSQAARMAALQSLVVGIQMMQGLANGITQGRSMVVHAMVSAVNGAIEAAKIAAEIRSPSKLTARMLGKPIAQGAAVGIDAAADDVSFSAKDMVLGGLDAAKHALRSAGLNLPAIGAQIQTHVQTQMFPPEVKAVSADAARSYVTQHTGGGTYEITVEIPIDGEVIARKTVRFTDRELGRLTMKKDR